MPLLGSCHPMYVPTILYSPLVWQSKQTKKDLVCAGKCLLNVPVRDLAPREGSRQEWIVHV